MSGRKYSDEAAKSAFDAYMNSTATLTKEQWEAIMEYRARQESRFDWPPEPTAEAKADIVASYLDDRDAKRSQLLGVLQARVNQKPVFYEGTMDALTATFGNTNSSTPTIDALRQVLKSMTPEDMNRLFAVNRLPPPGLMTLPALPTIQLGVDFRPFYEKIGIFGDSRGTAAAAEHEHVAYLQRIKEWI